MIESKQFLKHDEAVKAQAKERNITYTLKSLIAGHKKDLVITNRLKSSPGREAIYGWFRSDGSTIQPLSTVHENSYVDYSHGFRAVDQKVMVDGVETTLTKVLKDPILSGLISSEGPI